MEERNFALDCESLLSNEECLQIVKNDLTLQDVNHVQLKSRKIVKCAPELVGFMGDYYKLKIIIEEKKSNEIKSFQYFIKTLPLTNKIYREELETRRVIEKESGIYARILPNIQRYCKSDLFPRAYLTRQDIMVLEDYNKPGNNIRMTDLSCYTDTHHTIFMQHLAKFNAACLAWSIRESVNLSEKFKDILFELQIINDNLWYTAGVKGILYLAKIHPKFQYPKAQEFINQQLNRILLNMEEYIEPSKTQHNVLCHRDSWDRNIFWEYSTHNNEPISCRLVDFQLTRCSQPAIDVLYYLCNCIQDKKRRDTFCQLYYSSLQSELKLVNLPENLITEKEFEMDCKRALLPVLVTRAVCEPFMKMPKGWSQSVRESEPEKYASYSLNERTEMFERIFKIDKTYMENILLPIQDLLEYFGFESM